jgi:hypothetical protein
MERVSTIDLLIQSGSEQLILMLNNIFFFFPTQAILKRSSTVLSLPLQLGFLLKPIPGCPVSPLGLSWQSG